MMSVSNCSCFLLLLQNETRSQPFPSKHANEKKRAGSRHQKTADRRHCGRRVKEHHFLVDSVSVSGCLLVNTLNKRFVSSYTNRLNVRATKRKGYTFCENFREVYSTKRRAAWCEKRTRGIDVLDTVKLFNSICRRSDKEARKKSSEDNKNLKNWMNTEGSLNMFSFFCNVVFSSLEI